MHTNNPIFRTLLFAVTSCITKLGIAAEMPPAPQTLYPASSQQSFLVVKLKWIYYSLETKPLTTPAPMSSFLPEHEPLGICIQLGNI